MVHRTAPFSVTLSDLYVFQGHGVTIDAVNVLDARDLFAIAKFLVTFLFCPFSSSIDHRDDASFYPVITVHTAQVTASREIRRLSTNLIRPLWIYWTKFNEADDPSWPLCCTLVCWCVRVCSSSPSDRALFSLVHCTCLSYTPFSLLMHAVYSRSHSVIKQSLFV